MLYYNEVIKKMISKIKEIAPKENIKNIVVFDEGVNYTDLMKLYNEFDYDRDKMETSVKIYRNTGLILDLVKTEEEYGAEWKPFLQAAFPTKDTVSKLDNIFVNKEFNKLLLITNKRLMMTDLKRVNKKIEDINYHISEHNEEWLEQHPQKAEEKKTFGERVKEIFLK